MCSRDPHLHVSFGVPRRITHRHARLIRVSCFLFSLLFFALSFSSFVSVGSDTPLDSIALTSLRTYLQLDTSQPRPHYRRAITFLRRLCRDAGLPHFEQFQFVRGRLGCVCTLPGRNRSRASVVLNSHIDVVPVEAAAWSVAPPFSAAVVNGSVYARGSQDMKTQGIQYVEALRRTLQAQPSPYLRTVHVLFVPDEEIGGEAGMGQLVQSTLWRDRLRPGVLIDECLPDERDGVYKLCYGERQPWWTVIRTRGAPGHGGTLPRDTAIQRIHAVMARIFAFREAQREAVETGAQALGDVVGVNFVHIGSHGTDGAMNIIPGNAELRLDIRVPPHLDEPAMYTLLEQWLGGPCHFHSSVAGRCLNGTFDIEFPHKVIAPYRESLDADAPGPYRALRTAAARQSARLDPIIFPMSTDSRYVRHRGIPAFGLTALDGVRSGPLLHQHDENVPLDAFERGIRLFQAVIDQLANDAEWQASVDTAPEDSTTAGTHSEL